MQNYHQPPVSFRDISIYFPGQLAMKNYLLKTKNYLYFLNKLSLHSKEVADIFTYSLLPNHFHLVVRVKPIENIIENFEVVKKKKI